MVCIPSEREDFFLELNDLTEPLEHQQLLRLAQRAKNGDPDARREMIERNLRLVVSIARKYQNSGLPMADLIAEGAEGLVYAVDGFDPERGFRFSTYATPWIRWRIEEYIGRSVFSCHLPQSTVRALNKVMRAKARLESLGYVDVEADEIAHLIDMPVEDVLQLLDLASSQRQVSLDAAVDDSPDLINKVSTDCNEKMLDNIEDLERSQLISEVLSDLPGIYREVLIRAYGIGDGQPETLTDIANSLGVTRQAIAARMKKATSLLREALTAEGLEVEALLD